MFVAVGVCIILIHVVAGFRNTLICHSSQFCPLGFDQVAPINVRILPLPHRCGGYIG